MEPGVQERLVKGLIPDNSCSPPVLGVAGRSQALGVQLRWGGAMCGPYLCSKGSQRAGRRMSLGVLTVALQCLPEHKSGLVPSSEPPCGFLLCVLWLPRHLHGSPSPHSGFTQTSPIADTDSGLPMCSGTNCQLCIRALGASPPPTKRQQMRERVSNADWRVFIPTAPATAETTRHSVLVSSSFPAEPRSLGLLWQLT